MTNDKEGFWIRDEISSKPINLCGIKEVRRLVHDEEVLFLKKHFGEVGFLSLATGKLG